jgi:hypothetical protein
MKTSSAKAKGRNLQKYVVSKILEKFSSLEQDDCSSRSMGAGGEDVLLSPTARRLLPISIECKNRAAFAIYKDYQQAASNSGINNPVLVIKQNRSSPLAVVDLEYFLELLYEAGNKETKSDGGNTQVSS